MLSDKYPVKKKGRSLVRTALEKEDERRYFLGGSNLNAEGELEDMIARGLVGSVCVYVPMKLKILSPG